jgi:hypothetical protein
LAENKTTKAAAGYLDTINASRRMWAKNSPAAEHYNSTVKQVIKARDLLNELIATNTLRIEALEESRHVPAATAVRINSAWEHGLELNRRELIKAVEKICKSNLNLRTPRASSKKKKGGKKPGAAKAAAKRDASPKRSQDSSSESDSVDSSSEGPAPDNNDPVGVY